MSFDGRSTGAKETTRIRTENVRYVRMSGSQALRECQQVIVFKEKYLWLGLLDTFRALCVAPNSEIMTIFEALSVDTA